MECIKIVCIAYFWIGWFRSTDLKCMGFQEIICVSVNDPFVMTAWGDAKGATDKVIASIIEIFKKFLELSSKQKKIDCFCLINY